MVNVNVPFGFQPVRQMSGNDPRTNKYTIIDNFGTAIYNGDMVLLANNGTIQPSPSGSPINNIGVFAGCEYIDSTGNVVYSEFYPGGGGSRTNIVAYVYDDPYTVFKVQANFVALSINVGENATLGVAGGGGSTLTGRSKQYLATATTTANDPLRILRLADNPENSFGQFAVLEVLINQHLLKLTAGI